MKLSDWAREQGVHYQTAWKWARDGKMPVPVVKTPTGRYLVMATERAPSGRVVGYCRVSSADQRADLERQVGRVTSFCARLYGRRSAQHRAEAALRAAATPPGAA